MARPIPRPPVSALRRLLRGLLTLLLICSLLIAGLLGWILGTEPGSRSALRLALQHLPPAAPQIALERVQGRLWDDLRLDGLRITLPGHHLTIAQARLRWSPLALRLPRLQIDHLELDGVTYRGHTTAAPAPAAPALDLATLPPVTLPDIALPLPVQLTRLQITAADLQFDDTPLYAGDLLAHVRADAERVQIERLTLTERRGELSANGGLDLRTPHRLRLALQGTAALPALGQLATTATLQGQPDDLRLNVDLSLAPPAHHGPADTSAPAAAAAPPRIALDAQLHWPPAAGADGVRQPTLDGRLHWRDLAYPPDAPALRSAQGELTLQGTATAYQLALDALADLPEAGPLHAHLQATGDSQSLQLESLSAELLEGRIDGHGRVGWASALDWAFTARATDLTIDRWLADWPEALNLELAATGNATTARIQRLQIPLLGGELAASGDLSWADTLALKATLDASTVDLALWRPDLAARLSAEANAVVQQDATGPPRWTLDLQRLDGSWQAQPLTASGRVLGAGSQLEIEQLAARSGTNHLDLNGKIGDQLDLRFALDLPELSSLYPGLQGRLAGQGELGGTITAPTLAARLQGGELALAEHRLEQLALTLDWPLDPQAPARVDLSASGLRLPAAQTLEQVSLTLDGSPARHRLDLALTGPAGQLDVAAAGGWQAPAWRGEILDLALQSTAVPLGRWQSGAPASLQLSPAAAQLQALCLQQAEAELCASAAWQADGPPAQAVTAALQWRNLDPDPWLQHYLPGASLSGRLSGELALQQLAPLRVAAEFEPVAGRLVLPQNTAPEPLAIDYRLERLRLQPLTPAAPDAAAAQGLELALDLGQYGHLDGTLELQTPAATAEAAAAPAAQLQGRLQLRSDDLSWLAAFSDDLERSGGQLALEVALDGALPRPAMQLRGALSGGLLGIAVAGIEVTPIELALAQRGDTLLLDGTLSSGPGRLQLTGQAEDLQGADPQFTLQIDGERFQAVRLPEAEVLISPALRFRQQGPQRHISGRLLIPEARIEVARPPPGQVTVSADEVIVDESQPDTAETAPAAPAGLTADVTIELGDAVHLEAFGLETRLSGRLQAEVADGQQRVFGSIVLRDGVYQAYGQDLTIERGELIFSGPPEIPDLDLLAYRQAERDDVVAYLAVTGPADAPDLRIYSEPPLPDSEALAYLVTGRPVAELGSGGGDIYASALGLGLGRVAPGIDRLRQGLGLESLEVQTGDTLQDTGLSLGKQLTPRLYIGYSLGLFDNIGSFLARLSLTDRLELETTSGTTQAVDLFYRLDID